MSKETAFIGQSEKTINKTLCIWATSVCFAGYLTHFFSLPINEIVFFHQLSQITPAVDLLTAMHTHKHVARIVWLYVTYTAPFVLLFLLFKVKLIHLVKPISNIIVSTVLAYLFTRYLFFAEIFGRVQDPARFDYNGQMMAKLEYVYTTVSGTVFIATLTGVGFIIIYIHLIKYIYKIIQNLTNKP